MPETRALPLERNPARVGEACRPEAEHACRPGCAACCIAPSISSPIADPEGRGLPRSKPAGHACVQLDASLRCRLFGRPERPAVCSSLQASAEMCGTSREQALRWLSRLERETAPDRPVSGR